MKNKYAEPDILRHVRWSHAPPVGLHCRALGCYLFVQRTESQI